MEGNPSAHPWVGTCLLPMPGTPVKPPRRSLLLKRSLLSTYQVSSFTATPSRTVACPSKTLGTSLQTSTASLRVAATGKTIKLKQYNSYVFQTLALGKWPDNASLKETESSATDILFKHPGCINQNRGGGGGSETTAGAAIEFLLPEFRTDMRRNY